MNKRGIKEEEEYKDKARAFYREGGGEILFLRRK